MNIQAFIRSIFDRAALLLGFDPITWIRIRKDFPLILLGNSSCGWMIPDGYLTADSICYCAGVGEDISFDLSLIKMFSSSVWAFDPTPRSKSYAQSAGSSIEKFHFVPVGLWSEDKRMHFYPPSDPSHVSHSILNIQKSRSGGFEGRCRRVSSIMAEFGHEHLDLLKLDIEGAEYSVIASILHDQIRCKVICVEFDELQHPIDGFARSRRISQSIQSLVDAGYDLVHIRNGSDYTFVHQNGGD